MPVSKEALKVSELSEGEMKAATVDGTEVLLAKVNGTCYAVSNVCPHLRGTLSQGSLQGTVVTCPRHGSQFDLRDGHVVRWTDWSGTKLAISRVFRAPRALKTYPVRIDGDRILVEIQ